MMMSNVINMINDNNCEDNDGASVRIHIDDKRVGTVIHMFALFSQHQ